MLNSYSNKVYNWNDDLYNNDAVRACIDAIARSFAKMEPQHRLKGVQKKSQLNYLLPFRPNPYMSAYDFWYKVISALYMENNTYIYPQRDSLGNVVALYQIRYSVAELQEDAAGNMYLSFTFTGGQKTTVPLDNIVVLRRHYFDNDFFGSGNHRPLYPIINLLHIINQGVINSVKTIGRIVGILKVVGNLQPEDRLAKKQQFEHDFLSASEGGGVVVTDGSFDYININQAPAAVVDDKNVSLANAKIYNYFGIGINIVSGTFTEQEWNNFYEQTLEPLAVQISQELTYKLFSQREIEFGNSIEFVADRLSYMSTASKVSMYGALKEIGVISKGQLATIFNLPLPPDADKYLQSLNYVDTGIINDYQIAKAQAETKEVDDNEQSKDA